MSSKRKYFDDELEGTTKLTSDGDLFLKSLLEKQLSKDTNLSLEFKRKKEFVSTEYVPISNFTSGLKSHLEIQETSVYCEELEKMKMAGLSNEDIKFYDDSKKGIEYLKLKHKNLHSDYITNKIKTIAKQIDSYDSRTQMAESSNITKMGRHWTEFMLSVKPTSIETNLLKFAINNEKRKSTYLKSPMDNIKDIETDFMNVKTYEKVPNISKIRKRARALQNRIDSMKVVIEEPRNMSHSFDLNQALYVEKSNWDKKVVESNSESSVPQKIYGCEPKHQSNLYTVRNGNIYQIDDKLDVDYKECKRLSLKEINDIPKFASYRPGIPSKILFIKNLPSISELDIDNLFKSFNFETKSVKILRGKMRGCAFVELKNQFIAEQALNSLNGIILKNKPLVMEFGKKS
ncbi:hypothetical protein WA026_012879 [Henosepilachna vigintioctopunctata]|uniref:RRM domain-containing protein n=1 Tax=Henosepilachna vigintioctopunctata TaxID=420089 RepID=A0AAW1TMN8_9CUCU